MAFSGTWRGNMRNFRRKFIGNQWPKLAHPTVRNATSCWQRVVLGELETWESFVKTVDTLFMLLKSLKTLCSPFWRFTLSCLKQFTIFPMFLGCRILAHHYQREPVLYTCFFKFILSNTPSNFLWKGPFKWFILTMMVVNYCPWLSKGLDVGVVVHLCPFWALVLFPLLLQLLLCE